MKSIIFICLLCIAGVTNAGKSMYIVTELGNYKYKDNSEAPFVIEKFKSKGDDFMVSDSDFKSQGYIKVGRKWMVEKSILTPLSLFKSVEASDYIKGCHVNAVGDSTVTFRSNYWGGVDIYSPSYKDDINFLDRPIVKGFFLKYNDVIVIVDGMGTIILTSELDGDGKLAVYTDPKYNANEKEYWKTDCKVFDGWAF
jgi:hypothetical protein